MRLTIVQYGGNYREAFENFARGGKPTYHAQRYSVDFVGSLAERMEQVAVVCAVCDEAYDVVLPNKVRAVGAGFTNAFRQRDLVEVVAKTRPDRLVLTTPNVPLMRWAHRTGVRTITQLADSFQGTRLIDRARERLLAYHLNRLDWVGNHNIGASLSLFDIGVRLEKLIPWDWPRLIVPYDYEPRTLAPGSFRLAYVGAVSEAKGVGDLLRALRLLDNVSLTVFGRRQPTLEQLANGLDVRFAGFVATDEIPAAMREVDAVVVPSRHDYAEGLPGTIYQALATRTPLIASDHPMFRGAIAQDESALIFPAGDEKALASAVKRLAQDPELYGKLSANSLRAWEALQLPVKWGTLMEKWLSDQPADRQWLHDHRLVSGLYHDQIKVRRGVGHLSERASTRSRAAAFARLFAGRRGRFGQAAPHSPDLLARPVQQI